MKKHNFFAGPAILPPEVIEEAANGIREISGSGLSLIEISHRSKIFADIIEEAQSLVKELYQLDKDYEVLFLQGGASLQFLMVPYNLFKEDTVAAYLETGAWAKKAIKEARWFGEAVVVASSADKNFSYIPKDWELPENASYFHFTTNNTIYGTEAPDIDLFKADLKAAGITVVADMSSNIFSRAINARNFDLIYAGAQKNMGPAGTTLVIVRKSILGKVNRDIPTMLDYRIHIDKGSVFNTAPVFAIYTSMLTLRWIKKMGGLQAIEKRNREKADLLYSEIDRNLLFYGTAAREDRSRMNVTFLLHDESKSEAFLQMADEAGIVGIKGHRSVGGFRASIYNALPLESVQVLVDVMQEFERKFG